MLNSEKEIRELIKRLDVMTEPAEEIDIEAELRDMGMDSLIFIQLILDIEDLFNIEFPDEYLLLEDVKNIRTLCDIVKKCKH